MEYILGSAVNNVLLLDALFVDVGRPDLMSFATVSAYGVQALDELTYFGVGDTICQRARGYDGRAVRRHLMGTARLLAMAPFSLDVFDEYQTFPEP